MGPRACRNCSHSWRRDWAASSSQPGSAQAAESDHNCFDALVASLVARAAALGLTQPPETDQERDRAVREGWIHVPTNPLPHLLES